MQVKAGKGRYRQVQAGTGTVQAGTDRYRQVQAVLAGTGSYRQVQAGTGRHRQVQAGIERKSRTKGQGTGQARRAR
jgi:hypothetical protein